MNWEIYRTAFPQVVFNGSMVTIYYIIQPPHVRFMAKTSPTSDAERHNQNVIRLVLLQISNFGKLVKKMRTISEVSLALQYLAYLLHTYTYTYFVLHKIDS